MTATTEPLTAWDLDLDLTSEVPCCVDEIEGESCDRPAVWLAVNGCCGLPNTYCSPHRAEVIAGLLIYRMTGGYRCVRCKAENPTCTWRPL
jgi:hypothetical protein